MVVSFESELARWKDRPFNPKSHFWAAVRQKKGTTVNFQNINQIPLRVKDLMARLLKIDSSNLITGEVITQTLPQGTREHIFTLSLTDLESSIRGAGWLGEIPSIERISEEEPTLEPQNPFVRLPDGTKIFLNDVEKIEVSIAT